MKNLLFYIGLRHMRLRPARTILTTLGVGFGISLYVAISIINRSTRDAFRENFESISGKAKLTISAGPTGFAEEVLEKVRVVPGVKAAVPLVEAKAFFAGANESDQSLYILGADLLQESSVRTYKATDQRIIDDPLIFLNQPDSIIVTKAFATKSKLKIDSKIRFATTEGDKTFTVRGLLEPEGPAKAYGGSLVLMDIDGARVSFGKVGKTDRIDIVPEENVSVDALRESLLTTVGSGFTVEKPETQSAHMDKLISSYQVMLTFFSSLALLVGLFMVTNSVSISVAERKKEIGILRAIGTERPAIITLFVGEALMMGLVGSALGAALGKLLSHQLVHSISVALASQYRTSFSVNSLDFPISEILSALAMGTITAGLSALMPAWRASHISPLDAMKSRTIDRMGTKRDRITAIVVGAVLLIYTYVSMVYKFNQIWRPFEQVTQGASVLGAALFGPVVVFAMIRFLRSAFRSVQSPIWRLSQDNLLKSRSRTSGNIMALMVGLFLVMMVATIRFSFQETLIGWLDNVLKADIIVTSSGRLITADVQPVKEELQEEILKIPGIKKPGPEAGIRSRIIQISSKGLQYTLKAMDRPPEFLNYSTIPVEGSNQVEVARSIFDSKEPSVLVSNNFFLKNSTLKVGDYLELDTPSGVKKFKINGTVIDFASATGTFYMDRKYFKEFWKDSHVTAFGLILEPGEKLEEVRARIADRVGAKYGLVAYSNAEMRAQMKDAIHRSFAYTKAIEFAALLVALLGLLNTLLISVLERTQEIGMMRAIGTTKAQIARLILGESLIQGSFGAMVAVGIGGWVAKLWIENSLAHILGWIVTFKFPMESALITVGIGIFVAALAGVYPAKRAADLAITEALEHE